MPKPTPTQIAHHAIARRWKFEDTHHFVGYLENTLIPDLRTSGSDATADDYQTALEMIKAAWPEHYGELAPDILVPFNPWQPIATAPLDGTVVLTNEGTASYVDQSGWGSPVENGWHLCAIDCQPDTDYESRNILSPTHWMPIPPMPD